MLPSWILCYVLGLLSMLTSALAWNNTNSTSTLSNHAKVLILGAGMTGIIAARTLHEQGINDFLIIEARNEIGGRMMHTTFGVQGKQHVVELGANWVQGTQEGNDTGNPIWALARKHNLTTAYTDLEGSVTTYNEYGYSNYTDLVNDAIDHFTQACILAGERVLEGRVDMSLRSAYGLMGISPKTPEEVVCDYFQIDFSPSQTSWLAAAWNNNFTYVPEYGGYSDANEMCIDQRGFSYIAQAEAAEFLHPRQLVFNQTVSTIEYGEDGVTVHTNGGLTFTADHVLCTFSVGVLQNNEVDFQPALPGWKVEAINSITMATYTKIFLQFDETFWFPTLVGLYASRHRGEYPVWQSLDHVGFFPDSGLIFVTVTGDWSLYVEQFSTDQVQSEVMGVLRNMFGKDIPDPIDIFVPHWASNPLYHGSYANWGPSYVPQQSTNLKATLSNRLWFAGEGTSVEMFGFLQGAYTEGESAGAAIAECVLSNSTHCRAFPYTPAPTNSRPYQSFLTAVLPGGLPPS